MKDHNIFCATFKENTEDMKKCDEMKLVIHRNIKTRKQHFSGAYDMPTSENIAGLRPSVLSDGTAGVATKDIVLNLRNGSIQYMNDLNPSFDALHYVLLFPHGDNGWHVNMKSIGISEKDFACHRLMYRTDDSTQRLLT